MSRAPDAKLSVIVASLYPHDDLQRCLRSLMSCLTPPTEVIVVDRCAVNEREWLSSLPESVSCRHFAPDTSLERMLGEGIARSTGEIVAITDSSCVVDENWTRSILDAHRSVASPVIGGVVDNFGLSNLTSWAAFFCDYGQFALSGGRTVVNAVPGNNISIKRRALGRGAEYVYGEFWKTLWCRQLQSEGIDLYLDPAIRVRSRKDYRLIPFMIYRFHQGRCFAGLRSRRDPAAKRALFAAGSILIPGIFLFRLIPVVRLRKQFLREMTLSLPVTILALVCWAAGESVGYAVGPGSEAH